MGKKTLLIFSVALIALLALLPGAGSMLADANEYYYAYGKYLSAKAGVSGHNYVYDNDVYTGHVAEYIVVRFSTEPLLWIQVGWIKGTNHPHEATFYVEWQFVPDRPNIEYFGDAPYDTEHYYELIFDELDYWWLAYIDGDWVKWVPSTWTKGDILAVSEALDYASPPENELQGHHWGLKYYPDGWKDWDYINTYSAPPSYCLCEISSTEFTTSGAFPGWSLDWTDECIITVEELLEAIDCYITETPHNGHTVVICDVLWLEDCYITGCMSQYPC